jgi:transcriptional regulator with XRE-family HTH domain
MKDHDAIYARLKTRRVKIGLTQAQLAKMIFCSRTSILHWERGISHPTWPMFVRWAKALGFKIVIEGGE